MPSEVGQQGRCARQHLNVPAKLLKNTVLYSNTKFARRTTCTEGLAARRAVAAEQAAFANFIPMEPGIILLSILGYFALVFVIARLTTRGRRENLQDFFLAGRSAPWPLVAFGMIGTSLSGVTFISVPGAVGKSSMAYFQMVLGYLVGYLVIAFLLLPLYYRLNLTSIYSYLAKRFGGYSYRTGAFYFLLSRSLGSAARLYLVAVVLQFAVFDALQVPFAVTVGVTLLLILLYTGRGGIRTIIWTDTLQTAFMLLAAGLTVWALLPAFGNRGLLEVVTSSTNAQIFFFEDPDAPAYFWKQFIAGALITLVMTGLDQDMMQKNLSIRTLRGAQWNVLSYSLGLVVVNLLFLGLGVLLYAYAAEQQIALPEKADRLYPLIALDYLPLGVGLLFILGLIAAAYSSADGSLTALTTSFCIDFLGMDPESSQQNLRTRKRVHAGMTLWFFAVILLFRAAESWDTGDLSVITLVLSLAGYTYGPLLGLYAFGLFVRRRPADRWVPLVGVLAPLVTLLIQLNSEAWLGFRLGHERIALNGALTFVGLFLLPLQAATGNGISVTKNGAKASG